MSGEVPAERLHLASYRTIWLSSNCARTGISKPLVQQFPLAIDRHCFPFRRPILDPLSLTVPAGVSGFVQLPLEPAVLLLSQLSVVA